MTEEQIKKGLECCRLQNDDCDICPYLGENFCTDKVSQDALALIKRQQEEIDLLKMDNERMTTKVFEMAMKKVLKEKVRAEAIKEFADKLEANIGDEDFYVQDKLLLMSMIESLAKEMVGADNA